MEYLKKFMAKNKSKKKAKTSKGKNIKNLKKMDLNDSKKKSKLIIFRRHMKQKKDFTIKRYNLSYLVKIYG